MGTSLMERTLTSGALAPMGIAPAAPLSFLVGLHDGVVFLLPDIEARSHHAGPGLAGGVHILDSRDVANQQFEWGADTLFYFFGGRPGHLYKDIDHGYNDLRFFFARNFENAEGPYRKRSDYEKQRQLGTDEGMRNRPRNA